MTLIITFINAKALSNLVTLKTLKARNILKTLTVLKALTAEPDYVVSDDYVGITNSTTESITISPSNRFILSVAYPLGVRPIIFIPISIMKIIVKTRLNFARRSSVSYSVKIPSRDSTRVFRITQIRRKFSKNLEITNK